MYTTVGHYYWFALRPAVSHANFKLPIPTELPNALTISAI